MSETKTDVASTLVSTLFSLDPICFDVANATTHLDSITTCSECEEFIDMIEVYIEDVRKTVGVLDDVQKLRLISELQGLALKAARKSIRLQNQEFKDYIDEIKRLNSHTTLPPPYPLLRKRREGYAKALHDFSCSRHVGKKQRAGERKRSGNTTPLLPPLMRKPSRRWRTIARPTRAARKPITRRRPARFAQALG
ncbi:hypothetical protein TNCV_2108821 [Trichonephila clavipes]|nr:hypothetical protein TNCV_2108821 [Trichonephila clavipes]